MKDSSKWYLFLLSAGLLFITLSAIPGESIHAWMLLIGVVLASISGFFILRK